MTKELVEENISIKNKRTDKKNIIIYNDDVNTFDWVIQSLIEVCDHESLQAQQCAMIVHNNGKCAVKGGGYDELVPTCLALLNRQISAVIE